MERVNENLLKSFVKPVPKLSEIDVSMSILKSYFFLKGQHMLFFQNEIEPS